MIEAVMTGSASGEPVAGHLPKPFARASSLFKFVQTRAPQQGGESRGGCAVMSALSHPEGRCREKRNAVQFSQALPEGKVAYQRLPSSSLPLAGSSLELRGV